MKNKKGAFAVFLSLVFCSIMILILTVLKISSDIAISSSVDSLGNLYARNVLSEFDNTLKNRYGIIACDLNECTLESKINYYFSESISNKNYININGINCSLNDYKLSNGNVFVREVDKIVISNCKPIIEYYENDETIENRYITSEWIINSLPSKMEHSELDSSLLEKVSIESYVFNYFKNHLKTDELGKTYFKNEIEYIISGKLNDNDAQNNVYNKLVIVRNADNLRYIETSKEKCAAIDALAITIMPEAPLVFKAIFIEAWAYLEAKNDLKLLYMGKKVPIVKDDESFALDIDVIKDAILKKGKENIENFDYDQDYNINAIEPSVIKGQDYEGYLKVLLASIPSEDILYRIMDIIQINLKYIYSKDFLISDYVVGLEYTIDINKRKYSFSSQY